jgi:peptidylprolyl isomerase
MPDLDRIEFVTTESGLKTHDLVVGKGEEATHDAFVEFRFQGWLGDGTYWQGSPETGPAYRLPVSFTRFKGWSEGVRGMKEGGRRLLVCPPDLAFGEQGMRGVPPNATVVMDVELVRVVLKMTPTNAKDEVETPSGLKYVDIKVGDGESPEPDGQVTVHHTGWVEDGTFFRSSVPRGVPETFLLERAVPGWAEGVRSMKVGGKRKLIIPPELGYGDRPHRGVPPNSTLIYEVELVGVAPAPTTQPGSSPGPRPRGVRRGARKPPEKRWEGMPELP